MSQVMRDWDVPVLTDEVKPMAVIRDPVHGPDAVPEERLSLKEHFFKLTVTAALMFCIGYAYGALFGGG